MRSLDTAPAGTAGNLLLSASTQGAGLAAIDRPDNNEISFNKIGTDLAGTKKMGNGRNDDIEASSGGISITDGSGNKG